MKLKFAFDYFNALFPGSFRHYTATEKLLFISKINTIRLKLYKRKEELLIKTNK